MDAKFSNRLDMLKVVKSVCDGNPAAITSITELGNTYMQFSSMLSEIDLVINAQIAIITGVAKDKFYARLGLVKLAYNLSQSLQAYAFDKKNHTLEDSAHFVISSSMKSRSETLINECEDLYKSGTDYSADLVNYGISPVNLTEFSDAITAFGAICHEPDKLRKARKMHTKNLYSQMSEIINLLDRKMDRLVRIVPDTYSDFRQIYANAREIIDRHGKSRSIIAIAGTGTIEGRVSCAFDDSPVEEALVYIIELDLMVETDEEGEYYFEEVPAGTYTIKVLADTYVEATKESVEVLDGAELTEDFDLESENQG
jgi:hypothetical protein